MPVAVPHPTPWISNMAVDLDQNTNTMSLFPALLSSKCVDEYKIDIGKEIIHARDGRARIQAVSSSARSKEGGRLTLALCNETQHWLPNMGGAALMAVAQRNLAKSRDPRPGCSRSPTPIWSTKAAWPRRVTKGGGCLTALPPTSCMTPLRQPRSSTTRANTSRSRTGPTNRSATPFSLLAETRRGWTWTVCSPRFVTPLSRKVHSRRFYFNQIWTGVNEEGVAGWCRSGRRIGGGPMDLHGAFLNSKSRPVRT